MWLKRYPGNPILKPVPYHDWESLTLFNAAVVHSNGIFHMLYRAQGSDRISRLGYAVSRDGFKWMRLDEPVFEPQADYEAWGVEDPRITQIGDTFYMLYTGYSEKGTRVCMAATKNFITWERYGIILPGYDDKDAALFPEKIRGRYCLFHRIPDDIWIAFSEDLQHWTDHRVIMEPRVGLWDSVRIGIAAPPIKTEAGWLILYHGYNEARHYALGVALLALDDPAHVLSRPQVPVLTPLTPWEKRGDVPNVVFSDAAVVVDDQLYVYYGAGDHVLAVAMCNMQELMNYLQRHMERE
jgi:predicted GH43/DUF377 family glycosyl hydrolase